MSEAKVVLSKSIEWVGSPLYREFRAGGEEPSEPGVFQVKMSSEAPGMQRGKAAHVDLGIVKDEGEPYMEVLSHAAGDVDLTRFNGDGRAALLDEHLDGRHLGAIREARLSDDLSTRGVIWFDGISQLSQVRAEQVRTGSRPSFSIGYKQTRYLGPVALEDGQTGHKFAWAGVELSSVAVPMDPSAQEGRAAKRAHCIQCGDGFDQSTLIARNGALFCPDCLAAETPAEDSRKVVLAARTMVDDGLCFRKKKNKDDDDGQVISHSEIHNKVYAALDSHPGFKKTRTNGDKHSDFRIEDIHQVVGDGDDDDFTAIVQSPAWESTSKYYSVGFTYQDGEVALGDVKEVEPKQTYAEVDRNLAEGRIKRAGAPLDSVRSVNAKEANQNLKLPIMPKTAAEIAAENPEAVAALRTDVERTTRATVTAEFDARVAKISQWNKEVHDLATEAIRTHGNRWNGKPGEVFVVGEAIRKLEATVCGNDHTHDATERRMDFKRGLDPLITGSRAAIAELPVDGKGDLAQRCSIGRIIRSGVEAQRNNKGTEMYMPTDGAELEADQEIRRDYENFPGGGANLSAGVQLLNNMPSKVRRKVGGGRMQRDAFAGDFSTAGALISPEYYTMIELLRNQPALARAGMTILSGVKGNPVIPRMEAGTTAQSVAEGASLAAYDQVLGQIKLSPHRVGTFQRYGRLAALQSDDFEGMVMMDHTAKMGLDIDYLGLNGQGAADEPLGLLNQLIQSVTFAGSASGAYSNAVLMETLIRAANVTDTISYITTSTGRGTLKSVAKVLKGATTVVVEPVWNDSEQIAGRPAWDSQQVPGNILIAGAFRHLVMVQFGGIAMVLDTTSLSKNDEYSLALNTYIDYALRHNQAFCRSADSIATLT